MIVDAISLMIVFVKFIGMFRESNELIDNEFYL